MAAPAPGEGQLRTGSIGLLDVVFQSITYMAPGTGLVFAIGVGIPFVGNALPLAVIVALIACTLAGVAIGQMAKYIPSAGGIYTYAAKGLSPKFGFYVGYLYLGFATFLPPFLFTLNGFLIDSTLKDQGWWEGSPGWWFWSAITIVVVFCLTYFDVRLSGKAGVILGAIEIGIFVALSFTILADKGLSAAPFDPSEATSTTGIFQAAVLGILAFIGFEAASALGEEARNPSYTVPRGVVYSCIGVGLYYVFCTWAWAIGSDLDITNHYIDNSFNSWVPFGKEFWGSAWVLVFFALINSNVACAAAAVNNAGRVLFSMGRIGALPAWVGKVHPHHRSPYLGVILTLGLSTIMSLLAAWKFGAGVAYGVLGTGFTVLAIFIYGIACAACIGYFRGEGRAHYNVLLHVVIPILGIIVFIPPLYSIYFSLESLGEKVIVYPYTWAGYGAIIWLLFGIVLTMIMAKKKPEALEAATRAFGGEEADETPAESMGLGI
jgi:amino acid transporter